MTSEDQNKKIQEMQFMEQNLQTLMMQKQAFQMELSENTAAIKELEDSSDEVYKIIGQLMLKTDKSKISEELKNKDKILNLRLNAIEKQEEQINLQVDKLRDEIISHSEKKK